MGISVVLKLSQSNIFSKEQNIIITNISSGKYMIWKVCCRFFHSYLASNMIYELGQPAELISYAETGGKVRFYDIQRFEKELVNRASVKANAHVTEETILNKAFKHFDQNDSGHIPKRSFINSVLNIGVTSFSQDVCKV